MPVPIQTRGDHLAVPHCAPAKGGPKGPPSAPPAIPPIIIDPFSPSSPFSRDAPAPAIDPRHAPDRPPVRPPGHPDWRFPRIA